MAHTTTFPFDREKFRELVLYIARECAGDPGFGDTRLNKVLFFSDAFGLQYLGKPITGARYQKLDHGPAPRALLPVRSEMLESEEVHVEKVGSPPRTITVPLREPDLSLFTAEEIELVDTVIGLFRNRTAVNVSLLSHLNSPGWNLVEMHEDVPLETQFLSRDKPDADVVARGQALAARFDW